MPCGRAECIKHTNGTARGPIKETLASLQFKSRLGADITFKNPPHGNNLTPSVTVLKVTGRNESLTVTG